MLLSSFPFGVAILFFAIGLFTGFLAFYLVVIWAYNDAEKGQVYKPAYKDGEAVILDKYEEDSYHLN